MNAPLQLKAPFPCFGGKSKVADVVWQSLGDVDNYVEPFAGSLAVLLSRPHLPKIETVNDLDCMIANFWRAISVAPEDVAHHANWPVNEVDEEARHYWLVHKKDGLRDKLGDPEWFDAKVAGWWLWGICIYIGSGFTGGNGPWQHDGVQWIKRTPAQQGINRQLPHLGDAGQGILTYLKTLAARLRHVRVACGDWQRVCGPSVTYKHGTTGVFLDPPYLMEGRSKVYSHDSDNIACGVRKWALENGQRRDMRVALCGYDGEHSELETAGWRVYAWKAHGGFGCQGDGSGRANAARERIWFSPHCLDLSQKRLL